MSVYYVYNNSTHDYNQNRHALDATVVVSNNLQLS